MSSLTLIELVDPRGRVNRKGLILLTTVMLGAQTGVYSAMYKMGIEPQTGIGLVFHSLFLWLGIVAVSKRLHDLGIRATSLIWAALGFVVWSLVLAFAIVAVISNGTTEPGGLALTLGVLASMLPLFVLAVWLHCATGDAGSNCYGDAPGAHGFAYPHGAISASSTAA